MVILYQLYSAENVLIAWDQGSGHFQPGWTNTITQKASLAHDISLFEMAHPMIFVSSPRTPHPPRGSLEGINRSLLSWICIRYTKVAQCFTPELLQD